jgi:hypothetical protein
VSLSEPNNGNGYLPQETETVRGLCRIIIFLLFTFFLFCASPLEAQDLDKFKGMWTKISTSSQQNQPGIGSWLEFSAIDPSRVSISWTTPGRILETKGEYGANYKISGDTYSCYYYIVVIGTKMTLSLRRGEPSNVCLEDAVFERQPDRSEISRQHNNEPERVETKVAPAIERDTVSIIKAFYLALSQADGATAASLVVPEKRGKGAFNEANITRFYSSLREPLKILSIERISSDFAEVKYKFVRPNGSVCYGTAKVNTIFSNGKTLIQGISANC